MTPVRGFLTLALVAAAFAATATTAGAAVYPTVTATGTDSGCTTVAVLYDAPGGMSAHAMATCTKASLARTLSLSIVENGTVTTVSHTEPIINRYGEVKILTGRRLRTANYKVCFMLAKASTIWPVILGPPDPGLWLTGGCSPTFVAR